MPEKVKQKIFRVNFEAGVGCSAKNNNDSIFEECTKCTLFLNNLNSIDIVAGWCVGGGRKLPVRGAYLHPHHGQEAADRDGGHHRRQGDAGDHRPSRRYQPGTVLIKSVAIFLPIL